MKFKQYFEEETIPHWTSLLDENKDLNIAIELLGKIESLDGTALLVGGAVRDLLLGNQPKDIDISGNIPIKKIKEHFKTHDIGQSKDFGVIVILYKEKQFEYAEFRIDTYT